MHASQWQFTVQFMFVYFDSCNFNDCFTLVRTVLFLDVPNRECGDFVKKEEPVYLPLWQCTAWNRYRTGLQGTLFDTLAGLRWF